MAYDRALARELGVAQPGRDCCGETLERMRDPSGTASRAELYPAIAWLERRVAADPESWRTHRNLGWMLAALGRHAEAEAHLRRTLALFEEDAGAHLTLAQALYAQRKFDEYATHTKRAVALASAGAQPLPGVREFLTAFEARRPGPGLPPAESPRMFLGWNSD